MSAAATFSTITIDNVYKVVQPHLSTAHLSDVGPARHLYMVVKQVLCAASVAITLPYLNRLDQVRSVLIFTSVPTEYVFFCHVDQGCGVSLTKNCECASAASTKTVKLEGNLALGLCTQYVTVRRQHKDILDYVHSKIFIRGSLVAFSAIVKV